MNGPDHYRAAEVLLDTSRQMALTNAQRFGAGNADDVTAVGIQMWRATLAAAQVHATLALAAATAIPLTGIGGNTVREWSEALS